MKPGQSLTEGGGAGAEWTARRVHETDMPDDGPEDDGDDTDPGDVEDGPEPRYSHRQRAERLGDDR